MPSPKPTVLSRSDKVEIRRRYRTSGETLVQMSKATGIPYVVLSAVCLFTPGTHPQGRPCRFTKDDVRDMRDMLAGGSTGKEVDEAFGVCHGRASLLARFSL